MLRLDRFGLTWDEESYRPSNLFKILYYSSFAVSYNEIQSQLIKVNEWMDGWMDWLEYASIQID